MSTKAELVAEVEAEIPGILEELAPTPTEPLPSRYLLYIDGHIPLGEPIRSSRRACRNSATRIIRRRLFDRTYPANGVRTLMGNNFYTHYHELIKPKIMNTVLDHLEERGVLVYRNLSQEASPVSAVANNEGVR